MLGLPALSVVSVWSGRCLIYGDGITVNRLLPSWEWVSSPSPGTGISHLDKVALKLHCSENLSPRVPAPFTSPAPGFTRCSADTAVNKKENFSTGQITQSEWKRQGMGRRAMRCVSWPGHTVALMSSQHEPVQSLHGTGTVNIQPWMRERLMGPDPFRLYFLLGVLNVQVSTMRCCCGVLSYHRPNYQD